MYLQLHDPAFLAVASGGTPALDLFFSATKALDSRITFTRGSSATLINSSGLVETAGSGVARFTHDPVTRQSLGLLIEESRTNLLLRSEEFDNAAWAAFSSGSVSANTTVSPDGAQTADTLTSTSNILSGIRESSARSLSGNTAYTISVFVKRGTGSWLYLTLSDYTTTSVEGWFDLANGVVGTAQVGGSGWTAASASSSITSFPGGWYRIRLSATTSATPASSRVGLSVVSGNGSATGGNATHVLWGAQLEAGAFATSYIPTTSATVTRAADVATMTGTNFSSWYRQDEGTYAVDFIGAPFGSSRVLFAHGTGGPSLVDNDGGDNLRASLTAVAYVDTGGFATTTGAAVRAAFAYRAGSYALSAGGLGAQSSALATAPTSQISMSIGASAAASNHLNSTIARIRYYRRRLPNGTLQTLTT